MDNKFSERLIKARNIKGLSQKDAAKALNITPVTLNRYEKGHREPEREVLIKIADLYNCDAAWLLTGERTKEAHEAYPARDGQLQLNEKDQATLDRLKIVSPAFHEVIRRYINLDKAGQLIFEGKTMDVLEEVERDREEKKKKESAG